MGRYLEEIKYVEWNGKVFFYITDGSDSLSSLMWKILLTVDVLTHLSPCRTRRSVCALLCHGYPCLSMNFIQTGPKQSHTYTKKKLLFSKRAEFVLTLLSVSAEACLLKCSNMEPSVKIAAAFKLRVQGGILFPQRRGLLQQTECIGLVILQKWRNPRKFWGSVLLPNYSSIGGHGQRTYWLPTCWLPAPLPLLGEVEAADWK